MNKVVVPIIYGNQSPASIDLQNALIQLGYAFSSEEFSNGFFNETCNAVKDFKTRFNIPSHPCLLDGMTAEALNSILAKRGLPDAINFPIVYGMQSPDVKRLQEALQLLKFGQIDPSELKDGIFGDSTCKTVLKFQKESGIQVETCYIDEATANKINELLAQPLPPPIDPPIPTGNEFKVSGRVLNKFNEPIAGQLLIAFDIDIRGARLYRTAKTLTEFASNGGVQPLNKSVSDSTGYYELTFPQSSFIQDEFSPTDLADVIVFAIEASFTDLELILKDGAAIIGRSALSVRNNYTGNELQNWNVIIEDETIRGETEYSRLLKVIVPFLQANPVEVNTLIDSPDQINFLATETGQELFNISQFVLASALLNDAGQIFIHQQEFVNPDLPNPLELLYGIGRQHILLDLAGLAVVNPDKLRKAIQASTNANIIKEYTATGIDGFLESLETASLQFVTKPDPNGNNNNIVKTLGISLGNDIGLQSKYLATVRNHSGTAAEFWRKVLPQQGFEPATIKAIQLTNQISVLSNNHLPLMEELQVKRKITKLEDLLVMSKTDWKEIIDKTGIPGKPDGATDKEKSEYIDAVQALLNTSLPNQKIATMIAGGNLQVANETLNKGLTQFLNEQKDFNIGINNPTDSTFKQTLDAIHPEAFENLKHLQRILQVSPTPESMSVLYNENVHTSARDIAAIPAANFVAEYADKLGGEDIAVGVHNRARYITKRIDQVFLTVYDSLHGVTPALSIAEGTKELLSGNESTGALLSTVQDYFPNWEKLFGSTSACECEECRSITSPAAYLVDLLQFLSSAKTGSVTALSALFYRRPDLGELPLTCENTNTVIPYVDLVNEIMEYYVVNGGTKDKPYKGYDTGDTTTEELHANPQNTDQEAYRILSNNSKDNNKKSIYPFTLPYHQPLDRIRIYLEKLQTSRAELMEIFRKDGDKKDQITTNAINAEALHISPEEYIMLTTIDEPEVFRYFGYPDEAAMLGNITNSQTFSRTAGIDYTDLIKIMETRFINPAQSFLLYIDELFLNEGINSFDLYDTLSKIINDEALSDGIQPKLDKILAGKITFAEFKKLITENFQGIQQIITLYQAGDSKSASGCDISKIFLKTFEGIYNTKIANNGITSVTLWKFHCFIRLWKKLGWDVNDLDTIIIALGEDNITDTLINNIALLQKINDTLSLSLQQIACLWGNINNHGKNSLYNKLFLNKALKEFDSVFQPDEFGLYFKGDDPVLLSDHIPAIQAAMKISADELMLILNDYAFKNIPALSIESLSAIYRYVLLAGALQISIDDLIALRHLSNINPFPEWDTVNNKFININPLQTLEFIWIIQKANNSGFKIELLNYIIRGKDDPGKIKLQQEKILQTISLIRDVVTKIDQDNPDTDITIASEELFSKKLQLIFTQEVSNSFFDLIKNAAYTEKSPAGLFLSKLPPNIQYNTKTGLLQCNGILGDALQERLFNLKNDKDEQVSQSFKDAVKSLYSKPDNIISDFIKKNFLSFIDEASIPPIIAEIKKNQSIQQGTINNLYIEMYRLFLPYLKNVLSKNIVVQMIATLIGMEETNTNLLLKKQVDEIIKQVSQTGLTMTINDPTVNTLIDKIGILYRAALFINSFGLTLTELRYFIDNPVKFNALNFFGLSFEHWSRLADYVSLHKEIATTPEALIKIFQAASADGASIQKMIDAGLLDGKILPQLNTWFGIADVANFQNEITLTRLNKALKLLQKIGTPVSKLAPLATAPPQPTADSWAAISGDFDTLWNIAEDIKHTVKAKYAETDWLLISKAMSNKIRENQKQALIAYLLMQPELRQWGIFDADGLFEYFLIDVQMDVCMDTSRVVQALSSIQLFVDRILLNLESNRKDTDGNALGINPDAIGSKEWAWRKYYRVWQAAREIFLFPENWLEPEWRDDKTPFFKELEGELLQNDITNDSVETAFRNYLQKLEEVSNLDVCGMHQADPSNPGSDIYVFARTHHTPYYYYWRKKTGGEWTAWEKIPVDIRGVDDTNKPGVHLVPVFWKNRLILFWPEFTKKTEQNSAIASSTDNISNFADSNKFQSLAPQQYWEIKLAWSEYKDKKWQPKMIANEPLIPGYVTRDPYENGGKSYFYKTEFPPEKTDISILIDDSIRFAFSSYQKVTGADFNIPAGKIIVNSLHSKLNIVSADSVLEDQSDWEGFPGPFANTYAAAYQKWESDGILHLFDNDYLTNVGNHTILFSNQVTDFATNVDLKYPFFFQDAQRIYFVTPASLVSYSQWIADPDTIPADGIQLMLHQHLSDNN